MNDIDPRGLDTPFRRYWSSLTKIKFLYSCDVAHRFSSVSLESIEKETKELEAKAFAMAKNKHEYVRIMEQKFANLPKEILAELTTALSPVSGAGATISDEFRFLLIEVQCARSSCIPQLLKLNKDLRENFHRAITEVKINSFRESISLIGNMFYFLNMPENELMLHGTEVVSHRLRNFIRHYNHLRCEILALANVAQNTQTIPSPMNQPRVSSSTINSWFSNSDSRPARSLLHSSSDYNSDLSPQMLQSVNLRKKRKKRIYSNPVPLTNNSSSNQPEMDKDLMNFMSKLAANASSNLPEKTQDSTDPTSKPTITNATSRISKKPCYKPRAKTSTNTDSWLNLATQRSKKRSMPSKLSQSSLANNEQKRDTPSVSQSRTSILSVDNPSTPITPSSVPDGNGFETESIWEATNSQVQPELENRAPLLGSPDTLSVLPLVSECIGPESTQQPPEKRPIDRLLDAAKSASKETLISAVNDMRSAVIEMDELPDYAYLDYYSVPTFDCDLADFIESLGDDYVNEGDQQPNKKLKHDIGSVSMNTPFPPNNHDCTKSKQSSEFKPCQTLLDEINDTNEKLYWTVIMVVTNSSNQQSNGTVVRCTYRPIGVRPDMLRSMFAVESIHLSADFLVPFDYPSSPLKILDCRLPDFGVGREMAERTKSLFDIQVRCVEPLRVREMGKVWDVCARSVFVAYAKHCGTETLIGEYGRSWLEEISA